MKIMQTACLYILAILILVMLSIYTIDFMYITRFPAIAPFGIMVIAVLFFCTVFIIYAQNQSPKLICNRGHFSINKKEIKHLTWEYKTKSGEADKTQNERMAIIPVGGIDACSISPASTSEYPVFIGPSRYLEKTGDSYSFKVAFELTPIDELPLYLHVFLDNELPNRVKKKTDIFYGEFAFADGTATPENKLRLTEQRINNREIFSLYDSNIKLYERLDRADDQKKPKVFIGKGVQKVDDAE